MGGRGIATAALLILVALGCIAIAKRLEGERRMIRKLRELRATDDPRRAIPLEDLDEIERDTLDRLREAGVIRMDRTRAYINPHELHTFKGKRMRFAISGALFALLLAMAIAYIVLH